MPLLINLRLVFPVCDTLVAPALGFVIGWFPLIQSKCDQQVQFKGLTEGETSARAHKTHTLLTSFVT